MLQCLLEEEVRFLLLRGPLRPLTVDPGCGPPVRRMRRTLVGAYAVAVYAYPQATKDIRIFVRAAPENASSLMKALAHFGAGRGARCSGGVKRRDVPSTSAVIGAGWRSGFRPFCDWPAWTIL
jgi:hypothetical protein